MNAMGMQNWATKPIDPVLGEELGRLLLDNDLTVVWGLFLAANSKDLEPITSIILKFFDQHERVIYLVEKAITREVQTTSTTQTLFRLNNFASKLISTYCKRYGLAYIKVILNDIVETVCLSATGDKHWSLELHPNKLTDKDNTEENLANLQAICQRLLDNILGSVNEFPETMCGHLRREAEAKFPGEYPNTVYAAVGGFVFLRYIVPAIVVPQKYGLLEMAPGGHILRFLLLISKVIQTVANGVVFGQKEAYMMPLNDFIKSNQERVLQFLENVADDSSLLKSGETSARTLKPIAGQEAAAGVKFNSNVTMDREASKPLPPMPGGVPTRSASGGIGRGRGRGRGGTRMSMPPSSNSATLVAGAEAAKFANAPPKPLPPIPGMSAEAPGRLRDVTPPMSRRKQPDKPKELVGFDAAQLVGLMQYLALYGQDMRKVITQMDDESGVHLENYVKLSSILNRLGVVSPSVAEQINSMDKKKKTKKPGKMSRFNPLRSSKK